MTLKDELLQQREDTKTCLQLLLECKTAPETIKALDEIHHLLTAANDPVAVSVATALQASRGMDEESVLKIRDEFMGQFRSFLSSTDDAAARLESGGRAEPKPRRVWLFVAIGLAVVCMCVVVAVAITAVILAMGGT